jgi:perosamine synthetase
MIALVRPTITESDLRYLQNRLSEGLLEDESEVRRFEDHFAATIGAGGAVAVNSGTSGLFLALKALGVGNGDEVVLPSYTCVALLHAITACGAVPVLVDIRANVRRAEFNLDPDQVRDRITPRTRAVMASQMFGGFLTPSELDFSVPVIEDFTLSLGAVQNREFVGTFGTIGVCSLHHSKMLSCGSGGIVVSNDRALLDRVRELGQYDAPISRWRTTDPGLLRGHYQPAFSYGMSALQAALGMSQLGQLSGFVERRRRLARFYSERFAASGVICPELRECHDNVFFRFMIDTAVPAAPVLEDLLRAGIQAGRGVYPALHQLLDRADEEFPRTSACVRTLLSVPLYPSLHDDQAAWIADEVLRRIR